MGDEAATRLEEALAAMRWRVEPGTFCLAGFEEPPTALDLELCAPPAQIVCEVGETTLLARSENLARLRERHPAARLEDGLRWIRFELPMSWELTGFLAHVTGALAAAGVPLGAVCGYSRDHLFVAERYMEEARRVLAGLFGPEAH